MKEPELTERLKSFQNSILSTWFMAKQFQKDLKGKDIYEAGKEQIREQLTEIVETITEMQEQLKDVMKDKGIK